MLLYDRQKDTFIEVKDSHKAKQMIGSGRYAPAGESEIAGGPGSVRVKNDRTGEAQWVDRGDLDEAASYGLRPLSAQERQEEILREQYGDRPFTTFLESGASAATFGISDWFLRENGIETRESLEASRAYNPKAHLGGTIAGIVAPALASGGASLVGNAGRLGRAGGVVSSVLRATPAGLASRAGLATAEALGGKLGGRIIGNIVEGSFYGAGQAVQHSIESNDPLTAESLVVGAGQGALWGLGGGLAGEGLAAVGRKTTQVLKRAETHLAKYGRTGDEIGEFMSASNATRTNSMGLESKLVSESTEEATKLASKTLDDAVENFKVELAALKGTSDGLLPQAKLNMDMGVANPGTLKAYKTVQQTSKEFDDLFPMARVGNTKNPAYDFIDADSALIRSKVTSDPEKVLGTIRKHEEAVMNLGRAMFPEKQISRVPDLFENLKPPSQSVPDILAHSKTVEEALSKATAPLTSPKLQEMAQHMTQLDDVIRAAQAQAQNVSKVRVAEEVAIMAEKAGMKIDDAIQAVQAQLGTKLVGDSEKLLKANIIIDALKKKTSGTGLKEIFGTSPAEIMLGLYLEDKIDSVLGKAAGFMLPSFLLRGGLGKVLGKVPGVAGKVTSGISKSVSALARGGSMVTKVAPAVAAYTLSEPLGPSVAGKPGRKPASYKGQSDHEKRLAELTRIVENPDAAKAELEKSLGALRAVNPQLADMIIDAEMRKAKFLYDKIPKPPKNNWLRPNSWKASKSALDKFGKYIAAVKDPSRILSELSQGRMQPETVEAVRTVFPGLFGQIQSELMDHIEDLKKLPGQVRRQLSVLFDTPVDPLSDPDTVNLLQGNFQKEPEQPKQGKMKLSVGTEKTPTQRLQDR